MLDIETPQDNCLSNNSGDSFCEPHPFNKKIIELEMHCVECRFEHLRVHNPTRLNSLTELLAQQGQQVPVIVIAHEQQQQRFVLIDGYLRMLALKRLGQDTMQAEVWDCEMAQGLLTMMAYQQHRRWGAIEEALLLQELQSQFRFSQAALAKQSGRSKAWVSYRLQLLEGLSESILNAIQTGMITMWVANRVFAPFARANAAHADLLLGYLSKNHHGSRELHQFFEHYKTSPHSVREKMASEPALFFQSTRALRLEKKAGVFIADIEKQWLHPLKVITDQVQQLHAAVDKCFYANQTAEERHNGVQSFESLRRQVNVLDNKLRGIIHDKSTTTADDSGLKKCG